MVRWGRGGIPHAKLHEDPGRDADAADVEARGDERGGKGWRDGRAGVGEAVDGQGVCGTGRGGGGSSGSGFFPF